ncbi:MAG: cysteine rich repeat-containing protein [Bacillota bacterium]
MKTWMALGALILTFGLAAKASAENACKKDMDTLCAGAKPGEGGLRKCMMENKDKLSSECKAQHDKMKTAMKEIHEACHDDAEKFCGDIKKGRGRMMKCMKDHKDEVSQSCKDEMMKMKEAHKKRQ